MTGTPMSEIDTLLSRLKAGELAADVLPHVTEMLDGLDRSVSRRVFMRINSGDGLPPELAVEAWLERYAYHRLRTRLTQASQVGQSASADLEPLLTSGGNDG